MIEPPAAGAAGAAAAGGAGALEALVTEVPGPRSLALARELETSETRGVTYLARDFPVFWESARGATVTDVDGNRYLDFTAAFGVAATGHANPAVARAIAEQAARMPHGMGDVHPAEVKLRLCDRLARLAPVDDGRVYLASGGAEAVEFALKTAYLATKAPGVLAFGGAYHGLTYGALEVTGIPKFRRPWAKQMRELATFVPYPDARERGSLERSLRAARKVLRRRSKIGALIVEPIQGRAGVIFPPEGFLAELRALATRYDAVMIVDEIYTGFGRLGTWFACDDARADGTAVRPDILCAGKALSNGFPISAAIVTNPIAEAWPRSTGEALHTSTHLGNPMGCAAALAQIAEIERRGLLARATSAGALVRERLHDLRSRLAPEIRDVRGRGLLFGVECADGALANRVVVEALARGLVLLQAGPLGQTLALTPPLVATDAQLHRGCDLLDEAIRAAALAGASRPGQ